MREEELLQKLREAFQAEASERLGTIFTNLALFEKCFASQERISLVEILYRDAHSLKGAARAVNIVAVEQLCQPLETFLAYLKEHNPEPERELVNLLYDSAGLLEKVIADPDRFVTGSGLDEYQVLIARLGAVVENGMEFPLGQLSPEVSPGIEPQIKTERESAKKGKNGETPSAVSGDHRLSTPVGADSPDPEVGTAPIQSPLPVENIRIAAGKLDKLMLVSEEFISLKLVLQQHRAMLKDLLLQFPAWEKEWEAVRNDIESPGAVGTESGIDPQAVKFLELNHKFVGNLRRQIQDLERRVESEYRFQSSLVDDLLGRVRDVAMLPIATLFAPLSRMVRELARELGKQVDFSLAGETVEVDRRVLEEMKDPLIHILRNALDHGIEEPDVRVAALKPAAGKITCTVVQNDAGSIDITIVDDGQGIDRERLNDKAIALKLISAGDEISDAGLLDLIFHSGFSTSPIITELSGRGLGMAIVREKIENLGGWVRVTSETGCGSEFSIHLPVSMAISRGVLVQVAGRKFVLPSLKIERVLQVKRDLLRKVEGSMTVVDEGRVLALVDLAAMLALAPVAAGKNPGSVDEIVLIVVGHGEHCRALVVDEIVGEQEIQVKDLGKQLLKVKCIAGTTILGSGQVVPIIDVSDILQSSSAYLSDSRAVDLADENPAVGSDSGLAGNVRRLLVVDDSLTSRMLLQNILEAANYEVTTAVDGVAALTCLKTEAYDLVVSDVEMPRMDGFTLTENIRSDTELQDLPLILVTSLGSREDRERGVATGANAYIVKGEFDQNNLLQVIERLL